MAKKIKFPLVLRNGQRVYTMEELREYFHLEKIYEYFCNGKLTEWLENRYYEEEAKQIRELDPQKEGAMKKLCGILAAEDAGADLFEKYRLKPCTDEEWKEFLKTSYGDILEGASKSTDPEYLGMVYSPRFLDGLIQVVAGQKLPEKTRTLINKLAYGYLTGQTGQPDGETGSLLDKLCRFVNLEGFLVLLVLCMDEKLASYMVLSRYSSDNEFTNIRRVNFIVCTSLSQMYPLSSSDDGLEQYEAAEEMAAKLYFLLFPDGNTLFRGVMLDVYDQESPWMTEPVMVMYEITTSAMLDVVNRLQSETIREILRSYREDYQSVYEPRGYKTRISLNDIPERYTRILSVLQELEKE
jgi:hypothetical protein